MKERDLLYFVTALITSVLFLVSLLVRTQSWFNNYGIYTMPVMVKVLIPLVIIWVGWYFESKGLLLSSVILVTVLLMFQLDHYNILTNRQPYVSSSLAPVVKTLYVLGIMLMTSNAGLGFFTYFKLEKK
jgi:hypothetical protein